MSARVPESPVHRRRFLQAAGTTLALSATSYGKVLGSNSRVNVGFIGCGGRAQAHLNMIVRLAQDNRGVTPMAVCDVWDGAEDVYEHNHGGTVSQRRYSQGLYPAAKKCGLNPADRQRVTKDYRRVLDLKDVDAVCIATPDHWHARQTLDAFAAGKDAYVERPMTRTAAEAEAVQSAAQQFNRVLSVGVQSLADPVWLRANEIIASGRIGPLGHTSAGVFRHDDRGQWRFYRVHPHMSPRTVDWKLWLGHGFEVNGESLVPQPQATPFDPRLFTQWRCDRRYSSGPISDLLTPVLARLLCATGLRQPRQVVASSGLYVEQDGRTVPDVSTMIAEFADGGQMVLTASTISAYPMEEVIRGRKGAIKFVKGGLQILDDEAVGSQRWPQRMEQSLLPSEFLMVEPPKNETESLWLNFLDCVRSRNRNTLSDVELGAATSSILHHAATVRFTG